MFLYGIILATMGLTISWAAPACNNPVFAEVRSPIWPQATCLLLISQAHQRVPSPPQHSPCEAGCQTCSPAAFAVCLGGPSCLLTLVNCAPGCCSRSLSHAQIVPPDLRNLVYAFDRSFEMAIAALAAPLVGILAEHVFGFAVCSDWSEY